MAKNIDLETLIKKDLARVWYVFNKGTVPHYLLTGDPHPFKDVSFERGDLQPEVTFKPQAYQELGLKKDGKVTFGNNRQEWRIVEVDESAQEVCVLFALA